MTMPIAAALVAAAGLSGAVLIANVTDSAGSASLAAADAASATLETRRGTRLATERLQRSPLADPSQQPRRGLRAGDGLTAIRTAADQEQPRRGTRGAISG